MSPEIFILSLTAGLTLLLCWGFMHLTAEKWQVLCCVPFEKDYDGQWRGRNMTYYGVFNATACLIAVTLMLVLASALSIPVIVSLFIIVIILMICIPFSRLIARIVERKLHTSTVGGAFFTGLLTIPWVLLLMNMTVGKLMGFNVPVLSGLAALSIAYAIGEGSGRLACISFGCCYGKPLDECDPLIGRIFRHWNFIFLGETKKITYAHHYDGRKVIPVQALTAVLYTVSGMAGCYLFLKGYTASVLAGMVIMTQGWRFLSEFLRANYRGARKITAYQVMALLSVVYVGVLILIIPFSAAELPDIAKGLHAVWDPGVIIFLESVWLFVFFYTGSSFVTGSKIKLYVLNEKI